MDRTIRLSPQRRVSHAVLALVGLGITALVFIDPQSRTDSDLWLMSGLIGAYMVYLILDLAFSRVVAGAASLRRYDALNRCQWDVPYEDLTAYRRYGVVWSLHSSTQRLMLPSINFDELHAVIATRAPKALAAKRWKSGQVPPRENFAKLGIFDGRVWLIGVLIVVLVAALLRFWDKGVAGCFLAINLLTELYPLKDLFGRLSVTDEGVMAKWPWERREFAWEEINAVFRERRRGRFDLILVSGDRSLRLPGFLFKNRELVRKVFHSLPDGTLCVGFDQRPRGIRRRRKIELWKRTPNLVPEPNFT